MGKEIRWYAIRDGAVVAIPQGAEILTLQPQTDTVTLYALVDPAAPKELRTFRMLSSGKAVPDGWGKEQYVGTCQVWGAALTRHVFEVPRG